MGTVPFLAKQFTFLYDGIKEQSNYANALFMNERFYFGLKLIQFL